MTDPSPIPIVDVGPGHVLALAVLEGRSGERLEVELRGGHPKQFASQGVEWVLAETMAQTGHGLAYRYVTAN